MEKIQSNILWIKVDHVLVNILTNIQQNNVQVDYDIQGDDGIVK